MNWKNFVRILTLAVAFSAVAAEPQIHCEGTYPAHLQGVDGDGNALYWSFTTELVKTAPDGKKLTGVKVKSHHGDLCLHDGKIYVAVNYGKFNEESGADNAVVIYRASDLAKVGEYPLPEVVHGAGGIAYKDGFFYVVGGLPKGYQENYVYQYTTDFKFVKRHTIASGYTTLGIQTACYAKGFWWFGCYGNVTLQCDDEFRLISKTKLSTSVGLMALPDGSMLRATNLAETNPETKIKSNRAFARPAALPTEATLP